jgi:hypothetical protein
MTSNGTRAFLNTVLLGASLHVLDSVRQRLAENVGRLGEKAREHSVDPRTSSSDTHHLDTAGVAIIGIAVGVGIGLILAAASGEETRRNIEDRVRNRFFEKNAA